MTGKAVRASMFLRRGFQLFAAIVLTSATMATTGWGAGSAQFDVGSIKMRMKTALPTDPAGSTTEASANVPSRLKDRVENEAAQPHADQVPTKDGYQQTVEWWHTAKKNMAPIQSKLQALCAAARNGSRDNAEFYDRLAGAVAQQFQRSRFSPDTGGELQLDVNTMVSFDRECLVVKVEETEGITRRAYVFRENGREANTYSVTIGANMVSFRVDPEHPRSSTFRHVNIAGEGSVALALYQRRPVSHHDFMSPFTVITDDAYKHCFAYQDKVRMDVFSERLITTDWMKDALFAEVEALYYGGNFQAKEDEAEKKMKDEFAPPVKQVAATPQARGGVSMETWGVAAVGLILVGVAVFFKKKQRVPHATGSGRVTAGSEAPECEGIGDTISCTDDAAGSGKNESAVVPECIARLSELLADSALVVATDVSFAKLTATEEARLNPIAKKLNHTEYIYPYALLDVASGVGVAVITVTGGVTGERSVKRQVKNYLFDTMLEGAGIKTVTLDGDASYSDDELLQVVYAATHLTVGRGVSAGKLCRE